MFLLIYLTSVAKGTYSYRTVQATEDISKVESVLVNQNLHLIFNGNSETGCDIQFTSQTSGQKNCTYYDRRYERRYGQSDECLRKEGFENDYCTFQVVAKTDNHPMSCNLKLNHVVISDSGLYNVTFYSSPDDRMYVNVTIKPVEPDCEDCRICQGLCSPSLFIVLVIAVIFIYRQNNRIKELEGEGETDLQDKAKKSYRLGILAALRHEASDRLQPGVHPQEDDEEHVGGVLGWPVQRLLALLRQGAGRERRVLQGLGGGGESSLR